MRHHRTSSATGSTSASLRPLGRVALERRFARRSDNMSGSATPLEHEGFVATLIERSVAGDIDAIRAPHGRG